MSPARPDVCDHDWILDNVAPTRGRTVPGLALVHRCTRCGATSYEASAADEPNRPPLT